MNKTTGFCLLILTITVDAFSQERPDTRRISGITDGWGNPVTYVGTIQSGRPEGIGMFLYNNGKASRYVGSFKNGLPEGKGVLQFTDTAFIWGEWQQGKGQGKGAYLNEAGSLYIGNFSEGKKEGEGMLIFSDNGLFKGSFKQDQYHDQGIFISSSALYFNDNVYREGKKNGPGFVYDINRKKLYTGKWEKGTWAGITQPGYPSLVLEKNFFINKTEEQVMMAQVNKAGQLDGTGYIYKTPTALRYFGQFDKGVFQKGVLITDSSLLYGSFREAALQGYGSYYKKGKFYEEGFFENGNLTGPESLSINLQENAVYLGETEKMNGPTGQGWYANGKNSLLIGAFKNADFTGNGYKLDSSGYCTGGNWNLGYLDKILFINTPEGNPVNPEPETLEQAVSDLIKMHPFAYEPIAGAPADFTNKIGFEKIQLAPYKISPQSLGGFLGTYRKNKLYIASLFSSQAVSESSDEYEALCKKLALTRFSGPDGNPMQLRTADPLRPDNPRKALTIFSVVPGVPYPHDNFAVMVVSFFNVTSQTYELLLMTGDRQVVEAWRTDF